MAAPRANYTRAEKLAFADGMRKNPTGSEALLYDRLRPYGFLSQQIVCGWIVDMLHPDLKIIVEVDGSSHKGREALDRYRQRVIQDRGYEVWRFHAAMVIRDVDMVADYLVDFVTDPSVDLVRWWWHYRRARQGIAGPAARKHFGLPDEPPFIEYKPLNVDDAIRMADIEMQ